MMSKRQAAFRADYRSKISPWYSGIGHIGVVYAIGIAALAYCIPRIHALSALEWAVVPIAFVGQARLRVGSTTRHALRSKHMGPPPIRAPKAA